MTDLEGSSVLTGLARLRRYLIAISSSSDQPLPDPSSAFCLEQAEGLSAGDLPELIQLAVEESQRRARRREHLPASLLGETAWDILLDIFAKRAAGIPVSFNSTCLATKVPIAEAVRWISILEAEGLVFRRRDRKDRSCIWLDLTDPGMERMCAHFRAILADQPEPQTP